MFILFGLQRGGGSNPLNDMQNVIERNGRIDYNEDTIEEDEKMQDSISNRKGQNEKCKNLNSTVIALCSSILAFFCVINNYISKKI